VLYAAGLTQMLDYYAGNSYDEGDGRLAGNGSSRGARSGEMQVRTAQHSKCGAVLRISVCALLAVAQACVCDA
jgi:hypothetical protein